ncbi:MAG: hypothetical protein ACK5LO_00520 [Leucobacter sp.]
MTRHESTTDPNEAATESEEFTLDDLEEPAEEPSQESAAAEGQTIPGAIDWDMLSAKQAKLEWAALNQWVNWLRHSFGLPPSVVPPLWHRHREMVEELSALRTHRIAAYHPSQNGSAPYGWMRDFHEAKARLREWVQASGTRLERDRPTRITAWPGETPIPVGEEQPIFDRKADFKAFVAADLAEREAAEQAFINECVTDEPEEHE